MKKYILSLSVLLVTLAGFAQNSTTGDAPLINPTTKHKAVIIPFEVKMYMSDIDDKLVMKNDLSYKDIKAKFRAALDREIYIALRPELEPFSFYSIQPGLASKELSYVYNSIGYKYVVLPEEVVVEKTNFSTRLMDKLKPKEKEETYIEAGIVNGQVVSQVDNREKYMQTKISNTELITTLNQKYEAKYYIFINELDIKRGANSDYNGTSAGYLREIKVHYTIFGASGEMLDAGAVKSRFKSDQNDMDKIIKVHFPLIAAKIAGKITSIYSTVAN